MPLRTEDWFYIDVDGVKRDWNVNADGLSEKLPEGCILQDIGFLRQFSAEFWRTSLIASVCWKSVGLSKNPLDLGFSGFTPSFWLNYGDIAQGNIIAASHSSFLSTHFMQVGDNSDAGYGLGWMEEGINDLDSTGLPLQYQSMQTVAERIGRDPNGVSSSSFPWRKARSKHPNEASFVSFESGEFEVGDYYGNWLFEDLRNVFSLLQYGFTPIAWEPLASGPALEFESNGTTSGSGVGVSDADAATACSLAQGNFTEAHSSSFGSRDFMQGQFVEVPQIPSQRYQQGLTTSRHDSKSYFLRTDANHDIDLKWKWRRFAFTTSPDGADDTYNNQGLPFQEDLFVLVDEGEVSANSTTAPVVEHGHLLDSGGSAPECGVENSVFEGIWTKQRDTSLDPRHQYKIGVYGMLVVWVE